MILHPAALTNTNKIIPRNEMNTLSRIGATTPVFAVEWPRRKPTKPQNLQARVVPLRDLCEKLNDHMSITYRQGSFEPQMIAEHKLERETLNYEIIIEDYPPISVGGRTLIGTTEGMKDVSKVESKKAVEVFLFQNQNGLNFKAKRGPAIIRKTRNVELGIMLSIWDQPERVAHVGAYLITGPGVVLG